MPPFAQTLALGGMLSTLIAFLIALSVIVFVHEFGHYIVARWCGIGAEVFSLGFGPKLWSWRDRRGTHWQVAVLPFGGYVKFLGDANAASGKDSATLEALDEETRSHTMYGAALWRRAATVLAGPGTNLLLSVLIFAALQLVSGVATEQPTIGSLKPLPWATSDLRKGDRIIAVNGIKVTSYKALYDLAEQVPPAPDVPYTVRRNGASVAAQGPFPMPPLVDGLQAQSAAMTAGLRVGDVITRIDGKPIFAFDQLRRAVAGSGGRPLLMQVWSGGARHDVTLVPKRVDLPKPGGGFETRWLIGISGGLFFQPITRTPGPFEALNFGVDQTWFIIRSSLSGLYYMLAGTISSCNLRGPVGIAETSGAAARQGLQSFIWFIAVLSTAVGLLNLFPIPVLDGGHLMFFGYEALAGKPPSDSTLRVMMAAGMALILALVLFSLANDLVRCP